MEHLILDIQDRLKSEVPELQTIDENYGQLQKMFEEDEESDIYPVVAPAVFIDARDIGWSNLARSGQQGTVTVVITLVIDCYDDTHHNQDQRARIADRMALAKRVHWALQGWKPAETTKLIRTSTRLYHRPHLWKAYDTTYTCVVLDAEPYDPPRGVDGLPLSIYD